MWCPKGQKNNWIAMNESNTTIININYLFHQLMHNRIVFKTMLNLHWNWHLKICYMFRCSHTIIRERTIWTLLKLQLLKWVKIHWCGSFGGVVAYIITGFLLVCVCVCVCVCGTGRNRLSNCVSVGERNFGNYQDTSYVREKYKINFPLAFQYD